jgi:nitrite reductase (NO-forming)
MGVAISTLLIAAPASAKDENIDALPRQKVTLVAPPFVHPHEQATTSGPKVVEFTMTIQEKSVVIDDGTAFAMI